jgi:hypothetical protein
MSGITITRPSGSGAGGGGPGSAELYSENPSLPVNPVASGVNSVAIGYAADAGSNKSLAIGEQSLTHIDGSIVIANGRFASTGDAQHGKYLLRTVTVNNTPTEMFMDGTGGSVRLVLRDNSTWTFRALVTAHRTDASDGHAGYELRGVVYRVVGASSINVQGTISKQVIAESNSPLDITVDVDTINGSLRFRATGQNGKTIRWVAYVETVEITN